MKRMLASCFTLVAMASLSTTPSAVRADDAARQSSSDSLDEIVVTAQKRSERLQDVPISITVFTGAALDKSSVSGITEVLSETPGVVAETNVEGGGTQVEVRGVGAAGPSYNSSSPIGYYLDSVPFGFVKSAFGPDPNAYDLQRVEILRGPQGTLYGAGGENGVVRILSNEADLNNFELKGRATYSDTDGGGSNYRGDMAVNIPIIDGKLAVRAVVGYEDLSGWIDTPTEKNINDAELRTYRLKINALPTDNLSIALSQWSSRENYGAPSVADDSGHALATSPEPIIDDFDASGLKIGYQFSNMDLSSSSSYLGYKNFGTLDLTSLGVPGLDLQTGFDSHLFAEEILLNSTHNDMWKWSTGLFYRDVHDILTSFFVTPGGVTATYRDESKSAAVFGDVGQRFLDEKFEWTLGLRYFHDDEYTNGSYPGSAQLLYFASDAFHAVTPRAVLTWYPYSDLTAYASYSEGFRSGFEQGAAIAQLYPSFPPVKPDKLHNYEIGGKGDFLDKLISIDSALYYMRWDDVQLTLEVPYINNSTITAPVNGKSASGVGVDFGITLRPVRGLEVGATTSWNDLSLDHSIVAGGIVVFPKGARLNYSSALTASGFVNYSIPFTNDLKGKFAVSDNYSSKQEDRIFTAGPPFISEGRSFLIARTSFALSWRDLYSATLFVDNATNNDGRFPEVAANIPDWYPRVRPRTIGIQFDFRQ